MPGASALAMPIATDPSNALTRCDGTPRSDRHRSRGDGRSRVGITFASVVIGAAIRSPCATRRSAWLSTSPFSAATTYGGVDAGRLLHLDGVQRVGVRLADDADARPARVAEHGDTRLDGDCDRPTQQCVGRRVRHEAQRCCRRARRSRPPPCRRTTGTRRLSITASDWNSGSTPRSASSARQRRGIDVVAPHEHVEAGRVAAADLEAIDRRRAPAGSAGSRRRVGGGVATGELTDRVRSCAAGRGGPPRAHP